MPSHTVTVRRALLSVSDKAGLGQLGAALAARNVELISTGGSAKLLKDAGLAVTPVESVTSSPEMLGGRVKTLHPLIHGPILADRTKPDHLDTLNELNAPPIDLVVVNLYPFERTIAEHGVTPEQAIEQIDIGGPTLIRAAAKNAAAVAVLSDPSQYDDLLRELDANDGATTATFRARLARAAFARTARYDRAIAAYLEELAAGARSASNDEAPASLPDELTITATRAGELRYGENPHQAAAVYRTDDAGPASLVGAELLSGKPLSFNNLNDAGGALAAAIDLKRIAPQLAGAAVVKHTNPCGLATADTAATAATAALLGDKTAAFGGILALNAPIDAAAANAIVGHAGFLEVIAAPSFEDAAVDTLSKRWPNARLLALGNIDADAPRPRQLKPIPGGLLLQDADDAVPDPKAWAHKAGDTTPHRAAALAVVAAKHLTSNAIAIASIDPDRNAAMLVGAGAGQMDRVAACRIAVEKAGERASGAVAASDAFFPFDDGPTILADAGIAAIVHPGGSKRDQDTIDLCQARGIALHFTGTRHFRH